MKVYKGKVFFNYIGVFMSIIIDPRKEAKQATKRWFQSNKTEEFPIINNKFINFLEKSGERTCTCPNASPQLLHKELPDGTKIPQVACSVCGGTFYKIPDFSFVFLMIGRKGGGKTTATLTLVDLVHNIDPYRKIKIWQCPPHLISVLHNLKICTYYDWLCDMVMGEIEWSKSNPIFKHKDFEPLFDKHKKPKRQPFQEKEEKARICKFKEYGTSQDCLKCPHCQLGKKYFDRIERLNEIEFNDIVMIDEGIISVNAKLALSKNMRSWDMFLAVVRHKRVVLFCLFQRFEVIKALREMSDMMGYKSIPQKLIENETQDQIIRNHGKRLNSLAKWEMIISSSHQDFDCEGMFLSKVPYWYTREVSMSYIENTEFLDDSAQMEKTLNRTKRMGKWLVENSPIDINKPAEVKAARFILREQFKDEKPPITSTELSMAIEAYYKIRLMEDMEYSDKEEEVNQLVSLIGGEGEKDLFSQLANSNVTIKELYIFYEYCKGRAMTQFNDEAFATSKQDVSKIVQKVGQYLLSFIKKKDLGAKKNKEGEEAERYVVRNAWEEKGYAIRAIGSGGERQNIPSPDCLEISEDGFVRPIQVKERNLHENCTFKPLTFNTELKISNRLKTIAKKTSVKCLHCGEPVYNVLLPDNAYLYLLDKDHTEPIIKEKLTLADNKKTLKYHVGKNEVLRQDVDITKVKSPKLIEFLENSKSNIYYGDEIFEEEEQPTMNEEQLNEIVNFDDLLKESGIKV